MSFCEKAYLYRQPLVFMAEVWYDCMDFFTYDFPENIKVHIFLSLEIIFAKKDAH